MRNRRPACTIERRTREIESESEPLGRQNTRLAGLDARLAALLRHPGSCSQTPPSSDTTLNRVEWNPAPAMTLASSASIPEAKSLRLA